MSILELNKPDIIETETKAAIGRFFYTPEDQNESIHSRIINYTNRLFDYYRLNGDLDFTFIQLLSDGGEFKQIEVGASGDNVSLSYNGSAITGGQEPLWEVVIAHPKGRSVNQLMLCGGLHVIQRDYDHQGKLRDISMQGDIKSTWTAVEIILEEDLTQDYLLNDIPDEYLRSYGTISTATSGRSLQTGKKELKKQFKYKCNYTPEEARQKLAKIFEDDDEQEMEKAYREGLNHIVHLRRYDSPQAEFYIVVQALSERAAMLQDRKPDDTI